LLNEKIAYFCKSVCKDWRRKGLKTSQPLIDLRFIDAGGFSYFTGADELRSGTDAAWNTMRWETIPANVLRLGRAKGGVVTLPFNIKNDLVSSSPNLPGVKRPEGFDAIADKLMHTEAPDEQMAMMAKMEKLAYEDLMFIPLWTLPGIWMARNDVKSEYDPKDIWFVGDKPEVRFDKLYLDR